MFPIKNQLFGSSNEVANLSFLKQVTSHKGLVISYGRFPRLSYKIRTYASPLSQRGMLPLHQ